MNVYDFPLTNKSVLNVVVVVVGSILACDDELLSSSVSFDKKKHGIDLRQSTRNVWKIRL